ncbi:MAG TPA: SRPBCC family protein [Acidimicrobiales bacterium]|nr:SRPBCC family protein [Acidimicrobiales bacterium]
MNSQDTNTDVRTSVVVSASQEDAFSVFTEGIGSWWPPEHHILQGELAEMIFEPHVGGAVYDRATDGTECRWGRVLAYEPPHRFVITWNINLQWQLETNPEKVSEIEVTFLSESATTTRVELTHRHLDRHGPGWEQMRDAVGSSDGWQRGLGLFADRAAAPGSS